MFTNPTDNSYFDAPTQVVILNGPPSSGKDTLADLMIKQYIQGNIACHHLRFKTKLYDLVQCVYSLTDEQMQFMKDNKEITNLGLGNLTFRQALIKVSEEMIKPNYGSNYFGVSAARALRPGINIFSDGGFYEELVPIINSVGADNIILVRLHRPGTSFDGDSRVYLYPNDIRSFDFHNIHTPQESCNRLLELI